VRFAVLLCLLAGCDQIFGFGDPVVVGLDGAPAADAAFDGAPAADARFDAAPGPDASLDAPSGDTVTVTLMKTGQGTISGDLTCDTSCTTTSIQVARGTALALTALPAAGFHFTSWGASCARPAWRLCDLHADGDLTITADFEAIDHNLVFATAQTFGYDFGKSGGALVAGDAACAAAASSAGLTGTFVAFLSVTGVDARARLVVPGSGGTPPRGFVRMDGLPIADSISDLLDRHDVYYPVAFDENGKDQPAEVFTGSQVDGTFEATTANCVDFTSLDDSNVASLGSPGGGPTFARHRYSGCGSDGTHPIYCVMVDKTAAVSAPVAATGRRIWVSKNGFSSGGGLGPAMSLCSAEKPAGVTSVAPLLSLSTRAAADLLDAAALYVRPDGVPVGTGAAIAAELHLSGVWIHGDATPVALAASTDPEDIFVWTGAETAAALPGDPDMNCADWASSAPDHRGNISPPVGGGGWWWYGLAQSNCDGLHPIYCIEVD
jgi:hypothetical protein